MSYREKIILTSKVFEKTDAFTKFHSFEIYKWQFKKDTSVFDAVRSLYTGKFTALVLLVIFLVLYIEEGNVYNI